MLDFAHVHYGFFIFSCSLSSLMDCDLQEKALAVKAFSILQDDSSFRPRASRKPLLKGIKG